MREPPPLTALEQVRRAARQHGATVNDVILAAVAGALRAYLVGAGEAPDRLRAMYPSMFK